MISLVDYLSKPKIDGHMHPFDHTGYVKKPLFTPYAVGFPDMIMKQPEKYTNMVELYKKYMDKCPWVKYWCATGLDLENVKNVYYAFPNIIKGFGELKLYGENKKVTKNHKDIKFAEEVCNFSRSVGNLPVYIHYELTNQKEVDALKNLLSEYFSVPIILCHLGMNKENHEFAWKNVVELMRDYSNLYTDISWSGAKWIANHPEKILQLPINRCIYGSDLNVKIKELLDKGEAKSFPLSELQKEFDVNNVYFNSDKVIKYLFKDY